ncbi:P1 family peptidase [Arthrobacter sp. M4]|uniref:P1 family peptidase n=1 Tax=Arthrobacter sp. M4 TaxID=218160 RepID=UPI0035ABBABB
MGDGWLSGVTVVLPPPGTVASVDVRGGGPATHETDALDPSSLVPTVDAVVLTGGSAYGLASAGGAQRWCEEDGRGFAVPGGVVPIVPAAAIFDLGRGGEFTARPDAAMGYQAAAAAAAQQEGHDVERGNVGAGTGALVARGQFKGGVGTAAITLHGISAGGPVTVGAIAVVNALGFPVGLPTAAAAERRSTTMSPPAPLNTTLVVVATDADLDPAGCRRMASAAHAGIARALNPSHTLADGDTIFALATGATVLERGTSMAQQVGLITLHSAAADVVRLAILDGVSAAESVVTPAGTFPSYTQSAGDTA